MARNRGKRYREAIDKVDRTHAYPPAEAIALVKQTASDEVRRDDRGPHAPRRQRPPRRGAAARHARAAATGSASRSPSPSSPRATPPAPRTRPGPTSSAPQDLADRVEEGWTDFDVAIATPALMGPVVSKLGRVLGPQGKMPNPKVGTVTDDVGKAVERGEGRQGRVPHRPPGDHPPDDRQGELRRARAARELRRDHRRDRPREAGRRQGPLPALDHRWRRRWAPASASTPRAPARPRSSPARRPRPTAPRASRQRRRGRGRRRVGEPATDAEAEPATA